MSLGPESDPASAASVVARLRRWFPWPVRTAGQLVIVGVVIEFLVLPQLAGTNRSLSVLGDVDSPWLAVAVISELASLAAFAAATWAMIPRAHRPSWFRVLRIDLATIGINHSVPAGNAAGTALGLRLLTQENVPLSEAAFAKIAQGIGSAFLLILLLWSGLAVAIPLHGSSPLYLAGSIVGLALVITVTVSLLVLRRGRPLATRIVRSITTRLPLVADDAGARLTAKAGDQIDVMLEEPRRLLAAIVWASGNWLLDAFALWACLFAYGHAYGYDALIVSFALAQIATWVPITPGGLGIVEGILIPTLLSFGGTRGTVVLGVITYRLIAFWLTIPLGALAYSGIVAPRWIRRRQSRRADSRT